MVEIGIGNPQIGILVELQGISSPSGPVFSDNMCLPNDQNARLTFTAELFLRAIFKYQVEVFGEHELIFLVVPKIVTTMTLVLAGGWLVVWNS